MVTASPATAVASWKPSPIVACGARVPEIGPHHMTRFIPQRTATRASIIFTLGMGTALIVTAVTATTMAPVALWLVGLFVVVLLWLVSRW